MSTPPAADLTCGTPRTSVQAEIRQSRPFASARHEATLALLRTASIVRRVLERVVEPYGLSLAQYNALRIVRGAGTGGIATLSIRERMLEEGTTITRLVDKLEAAGLLRRERDYPDRRQVLCFVTEEGVRLLDQIDPKADAMDGMCTDALSEEEAKELVRLLDAVRACNAVRGAARCNVPSPRRATE